MCVGEAEVRPSKLAVLKGKGERRETHVPIVKGNGGKRVSRTHEEGNLAPVIGRWAEACFPVGSQTSEADLRELLREAAESAREDYGPEAAVEWAEGYVFPPEYLRNDVCRPIYETVASAVNKMLGAIVAQELAFLLPLEMAQQHVPNLHLCKAHWTVKKGKACGRPLGDLSNVDGTKLNTDQTAEAATGYYGAIRHPTIDDIAVMIYDFWRAARQRDPTVRWADMRIWKMDFRGAYTLLSFRPEDVGLFAMLLSDDLVYLQIVGIFGWSGTPAAFQVVTQAITWELRHALQSRTVMYVDDIIGVCMVVDLEADLIKTREICTSLLGPESVADDKTEYGVRLDVIGYTINLPDHRILISRKNFLTALHGFISADVSGLVNLRQAQRLASYGTRYG